MIKVFSVIIPVRNRLKKLSNNLVSALEAQTYKNFEILIANKPGFAGPALKRDLAAKKATGKILAFIDDDVYPYRNWLKNALSYFKNDRIAAVCGPGITPPSDNLKQKAAGYILSSFLGAGGAGTYRSRPEKKREVDDYPTFNLIVRKSDFEKIGGFNTNFWPGEDTKLCHDLVYKLGKKIIYDPKILVYHHRRELFLPFLKQISRFGFQRGYFAKIISKTSLKFGYFIPSLFVFFIFIIPLILYFSKNLLFLWSFYFLILGVYLLLILFAVLNAYRKEKKLIFIPLLILGIPLTHIIYGVYFIKGFFLMRKS